MDSTTTNPSTKKLRKMSEKTVQDHAKCRFCGAPIPVIEVPMPVLDEDQEAWAAAYQKRLNTARDELMSERETARAAVEAKAIADRKYSDMINGNADLKRSLTKSQGYTWLWFIATVVVCIIALS